MATVAWLPDLDRDDLPRVGGKAANLGELLRAGLPVPPGFVVTTDAYARFVAAHGLQAEIERLAHAADPEDVASLDAASRAIGELFAARPIPEDIEAAVRAAYQKLGQPPVAVRSSATAEDLAEASFAGQMESYLNVRGEEDLLAAVRRCWASLWTARAIAYRARQNIPASAVRLAVVVQRMVEADAAGVLFTANPVTGHRGQMVVDAVRGLGEALVAGQVNPDHWVLDGASGGVLETRLAQKEPGDQPVLDAATLARLAELGRRAAVHFGAPQDIEWAEARGDLYLVQSRPITSLFPLPQPAPAAGEGLRVYLCVNLLQGIVEPFTPVGIDLFRCLMNAREAFLAGVKPRLGRVPPGFKVAAGRLFLDFTDVLRHPRNRNLFPRFVGIVDRHVTEILRGLMERDPRLTPVRQRPSLDIPLGFAARLLGRMAWVLISPERASVRLSAGAERLAGQFEQAAEAVHEPAACRRFVEGRLAALFPEVMCELFPLVLPSIGARFLADAVLRRWGIDPAALQPVLRSFPHNPTMEMDLALWRISRALAAEGAEPSADHPLVRAFLARYGHRAVREIDVGMPRWRDEPGHVLNVLRTYLAHPEDADPEQKFRQGEEAAEQASRDLVERVRREKGWLRAKLLAWLLRRVRALGGRREFPKFLMIRIFASIRRALTRAGAALVAAGRLGRAEDVFFLDLAELESSADLRARVAQRRAEYDREMGRRAVPRVMTSEGESFYTAPSTVPGALVGTAASAGSYEGTVRVVFDPAGARLEPGEVLVAPGTDPAWTPLFLSAGALVMELGGIMSHGSVVAREYGIPAVVGVPGATRQLRTGQRVRVDGEAGQVIPL
jgi:pyruvate,water dikinase